MAEAEAEALRGEAVIVKNRTDGKARGYSGFSAISVGNRDTWREIVYVRRVLMEGVALIATRVDILLAIVGILQKNRMNVLSVKKTIITPEIVLKKKRTVMVKVNKVVLIAKTRVIRMINVSNV